MTRFLNISTDNTLGGLSPSDEFVASQKAIKEYVDNNSSNVQIDDLTITQNANDDIQAVGTINKNTAAGAQNPVYDWVGTYQEWADQDVATSHPEWVCFITDDASEAQIMVTTREVGEIIYTTVPTTNAALHLADGTLLNGTGVYKSFYDHMVGVYDDGHTSMFCSEADWQTSNTNYGKCGKYVLDTTNHTIRLPKIPGFIEGTLTESQIGSLVGAGLPNILGTADAMAALSNTTSGALTKSSQVGADISIAAGATYKRYTLGVDASASNPIYGNSSTVQPESIKVYVYVVIANSETKPITVDINNIVADLDKKANLSLDNSTAITNCITEIPQDISFTITNGHLIVNAGSKVYFPNGSGTFDVFTLPSNFDSGDVSGITADYMFFINASKVGIAGTPVTNTYSGTTAPSGPSTGTIWYDTTNNSVKRWSGSAWVGGFSFPVAILSAGAVLHQVFNGFGYIGKTLFALPGVKGLIPNNKNTDGTLNNTEFTSTSVVTRTLTSGNFYAIVGFDGTGFGISDILLTEYNQQENLNYSSSSVWNECFIGSCSLTSGVISNFVKKQVFHAVDYNDTEYIAHQAMPSGKYVNLTLGASGNSYTAPADGYVYFRKDATAVGQYFVLYGNNIQNVNKSATPGGYIAGYIPVKKGDTFKVEYNLAGSTTTFRFVYAQGAI